MLRKLTIELDKIVIGSDLNAAKFAYENKASFIRNCDPSIFVFDSLQDGVSFAGVEYNSQIEYWDHLVWDLAMRGFCPLGDLVRNIRLDDDGLTVATQNERVVKVRFNKCYVFDLANTSRFPFEGCEVVEQFRVFDWFWVKGMTRHQEKILYDDDDQFIKTIHFFVEDKTTGIATESVIACEELEGFNRSPTYARLKAEHMIKQGGLKSIYKTLKLDFFKRESLPVKKTNYKEHENVIFMGEAL